jgi:hypothetical protein
MEVVAVCEQAIRMQALVTRTGRFAVVQQPAYEGLIDVSNVCWSSVTCALTSSSVSAALGPYTQGHRRALSCRQGSPPHTELQGTLVTRVPPRLL